MNTYEFNKLNTEEKWEERTKDWAIKKPELYVRYLILNDEITLLKQYEKEPVEFDFTYQLKDEILLTLAMEKNAYKVIDYLLNKGLIIKERDIIALVKNFTDKDNTKQFIEVLDKIDFKKFDVNKILKALSDYFYDEHLNEFVDYVLDLKIEINDTIMAQLEENEDLAFVIKKNQKRKEFDYMNEKFPNKSVMKGNKI